MNFRFWILDFGLIPLVAICNWQFAICDVHAGDEPTGPRLILAMQSPPAMVRDGAAPALPTPPPEADCAASGQPLSTARTLTAPPALPLSSTLLQWGRQERRAERRQSLFHPLRRFLTVPGRLILTPYAHPVEK